MVFGPRVGLFLGRKSKILQEQNVKEFQFYIRMTNWNFRVLRSYKKVFCLFYVFFDVESDSEVRFIRSPLVFEL